MLLYTLEFLAVVLIAAGVITQIIVPGWRNERLFPMFRARRSLDRQLRDVRTQVGDKAFVEEIKRQAEKLLPPPSQAASAPAPTPDSPFVFRSETTTTTTKPKRRTAAKKVTKAK